MQETQSHIQFSPDGSDFQDSQKKIRELMNSLVLQNSSRDLQEMCLYHLQTPGKMIRSLIILSLGEIYQVSFADLKKWACACELLHEASLVYDDYQDGDEVRRGQPTVWKKYTGVQAINVGNFLLMLSQIPLTSVPPSLIHLHIQTSIQLVQGQVDEQNLNRLFSCKSFTEKYIQCARQKTGALFQGLACGVALLAEKSEIYIKNVSEIFSDIGIIFQTQDDLLDLYGNKQRKEVGTDIKEGKCSVLIAIHLEKHPEDLAVIEKILKTERILTRDEDVIYLKHLFQSKGTLKAAIQYLHHRIALIKEKNTCQDIQGFIEILVEKILNPIKHLLNN